DDEGAGGRPGISTKLEAYNANGRQWGRGPPASRIAKLQGGYHVRGSGLSECHEVSQPFRG
ncbi:hypothetical protein GGTG_14446, partial [Gaeumannomyces tritici R3-111a-1]